MKKIYLLFLFFIGFVFYSFASENKSEILPKKEISATKILLQKNKVAQFKQQKFSFKERLALKLVEKKIDKIEKQKKYSKQKKSEIKNNSINILLLLWLIVGITIGLYYIIFNELLPIIFLILIGAVGIALILFLLFAISLLILPSNFPIS